MKTKILLIAITIGLSFSCNFKSTDQNQGSVKVEIKYAKDSTRNAYVSWKQGLTALEALQYAANIETHPIGKYVFVSSIDATEGVRGEKGWYYKINGESAKVLAIDQSVKSGDVITWIYKEDICSGSVDNCN